MASLSLPDYVVDLNDFSVGILAFYFPPPSNLRSFHHDLRASGRETRLGC